MGLADLKKRLTTSVTQLDQGRLQTRCAGLDLTPLDGVEARVPVRVGGEVQSYQVTKRDGVRAVEVVVSDGTGKCVAVFTGRSTLGGFDPGRAVLFEGVGRHERGRLVLVNPAYTLLP